MTSTRQRAVGVLGAVALLAAAIAPAAGATSGTTAGSATVAADDRKGLPGVWWYDAMKLDEVHQVATGKGVKVAVIDGHLDDRVPDLEGAKISMGTSCQYDTKARLYTGPIASHGTAMVTAIVGQGAGGKGILGVAPDAEVRFYSFDSKPENPGNECDAVLIANQVDKAVKWGADVISMSLGVGGGLEESVGRAIDSGAVVVASSGEVPDGEPRNEQPIERPASIPGVVAVVAGTKQGKVWSKNPKGTQYEGSKLNSWLGLVAPGVATPLGGFRDDGTWMIAGSRTGTSGATAIAAGAFAVLKSRWPEATGNQLVQAALHAAGGRNSDGELSYGDEDGFGTLSLQTTLAQDPTGWPDENPLRKPPGEAIKAYPASVYQEPGQDAADPEAQDGGASSASDASDGSKAADDAASTQDNSVPGWALAVGVVVLVALAAGALLLRRRSGTTDRPGASSTDQHTTGTTYDHTAPRGS